MQYYSVNQEYLRHITICHTISVLDTRTCVLLFYQYCRDFKARQVQQPFLYIELIETSRVSQSYQLQGVELRRRSMQYLFTVLARRCTPKLAEPESIGRRKVARENRNFRPRMRGPKSERIVTRDKHFNSFRSEYYRFIYHESRTCFVGYTNVYKYFKSGYNGTEPTP